MSCLCRVKPRRATRKAGVSDSNSPVNPKKRKGESPITDKRGKKQRLEEPEHEEVITEAATHEEPREEVPESSSEGEDAEAAALKEQAAREERKAAKERRSTMGLG